MKKLSLLLILIISFTSCQKELDEFGCWEIYSKCPSEQYGGSNEVCGKTESDIKLIIQEFKDHDKIYSKEICTYKYKFIK